MDLKGILGDDVESRETVLAAVDQLVVGLKATLATLDGWTLTIAHPSLVGQITIRLSKPKQ
jgi:hypothetical protein